VTKHSITSSQSFQSRVLDAEKWRIGMLAVCLVVLLGTWLMRRALGGMVASEDSVFVPIVIMLCLALALSVAAYIDVIRRAKSGSSLPWWRFVIGAALDIGGPFGILFVLHLQSPRGTYAALTGPALLIVPIVIMLSVLRLRPRYSLVIGLGAAICHWSLALSTIRGGGMDANLIPLLISYGLFLALTGAAAAVLAMCVRRYIQDAVREAEAAERAAGKLSEMERELDIARDIQQSLLPTDPPALVGFEVAGMARAATQAGGDYYDWQELPDGRFVVAIADVTGHGIGPALVMAVCRAYARATAPRAINAADFLERMNNLIVKDVSDGRFITMAVALVSPDGSIELLSAGHGPTFHFRAAEGTINEFGGNGIPLGIMRGEQYDPTSYFKLAPGDSLVLLTDGFMERARADGQLFGTDRLSDVIVRNGGRSAADLVKAIDTETTAFAGDFPQGDDMTVVVLRRV
jgi:serine phosphatase RsbU (regulator of sigma subunit)